jgi:hypothetical protein
MGICNGLGGGGIHQKQMEGQLKALIKHQGEKIEGKQPEHTWQ